MQKSSEKKQIVKPQAQKKPGVEAKMKPVPQTDNDKIPGRDLLLNKIALISGGDSGIGKAVAIQFAKEGADVAIMYLSEDADAQDTKTTIEKKYNRKCILLKGNIAKESTCISAVKKAIKTFGQIDILVNNAATQTEQDSLVDISSRQLLETYSTNIFSMFWLTKAALPFMKKGSAIINTTSVTAYRGSAHLIDYSSTKGAIVSFTRSLSANLVDKGIRVNAVAPGPIWTPLIVSSFDKKKVATFGSDVPLKRPGQPWEVASCYVFLASSESSYMTGQVLHPNGGEIING
jgi:NAD(P)-dependent dehydrogenase (short-subunit alcohol dehydrogenase family)